MIDSKNCYANGYGTCGDQKYLEVIQSIFRENTAIVDENFGHLAPWNVTYHKYDDGKIVWKEVKQNLCYFHFAHFVIENEQNYRASYNNEWIWGDPLKVNYFVNKCYDEYFYNMKKAISEINLCV